MEGNCSAVRFDAQQDTALSPIAQEQRRNRDKPIVGRARSLANLKPFKKGTSGNLNGRPKGESLTAVLRRLLEEVGRDGRTNCEAIAEALIRLAKRGNVKAISLILDRTEGKVPNKIEDSQGSPVKIEVVWVNKGLAGEGEEEAEQRA